MQIAYASDAMIAYSSTSGSGSNFPKIKIWNSSDAGGNGTWGPEIELPTSGSKVRWLVLKVSPVSNKTVLITQGDDGLLDSYVCMDNCSDPLSWLVVNNIGDVEKKDQRRFDVEFETATEDAVLVYSVFSGDGTKDLAYQVLPAASTDFTGIAEEYIDDTSHAGDVKYRWVKLDRNPVSGSEELALVAYEETNKDINAWVWDGNVWGNQIEVSTGATALAGHEAIGVKYAADGSLAMVVGANGTTGDVDWTYWNGASWSAIGTFDINSSNANDAAWLRLKADPASDDLQAMAIDAASDLHTIYWDGSTWSAPTTLDVALDVNNRRDADFEWNPSGSTGLLVWDTDGAGLNISTMPCTPECTNAITNVTSYISTGVWITLFRNPDDAEVVNVLGVRLDGAKDIGSFFNDGVDYSNYGDEAISANTDNIAYEAYSLAFISSVVAPPPPPGPGGSSGGGGGGSRGTVSLEYSIICPSTLKVTSTPAEATIKLLETVPYIGLIATETSDTNGLAWFNLPGYATYELDAMKSGYNAPGPSVFSFGSSQCGEVQPPVVVQPPPPPTQPPPQPPTTPAQPPAQPPPQPPTETSCGNGVCDRALGESSVSCPTDCKLPPKPPKTVTAPPPSEGAPQGPDMGLVAGGVVVLGAAAGAWWFFLGKKGGKKQ